MRALVVLTLIMVAVSTAKAARCYQGHHQTNCGFWGWRRCTDWVYTTCTHGGWTEWAQVRISSCSKTCGAGTYTVTRTRSCTNPKPSGRGAKQCEGKNSMTTNGYCNVAPCFVHGGWTEWRVTGRTPCSKTCGYGTITRTETRSCTNPAPKGPGGRPCQGSGTRTVPEDCHGRPCYVHGGWSAWTVSSSAECSATCGVGLQQFNETRSCSNPRPFGKEGRNCTGVTWRTRNGCCSHGACPNWLNSTCKVDSDCPATHSVCVEGQCLCEARYYYSWSADSCVPECSQEDRQRIFLKYPSHSIPGDVPSDSEDLSPEGCVEWCRNQRDCDFVNYFRTSRHCYRAPSFDRILSNQSVDFYRATCA